jgi:hypothetical protein
MAERQSAAAQIGLVLSVLCIGLAGGAMLTRPPAPRSAEVTWAGGPLPGHEPVRKVAPRQGVVLEDHPDEVWPGDSIRPGSRYAPVDGSAVAAPMASVPSPERIPDAPVEVIATVTPPEEPGGVGEATEPGGVAQAAAAPPAPRSRGHDDEVASLSPARAGGAVLFAVSDGHQTVLFDVGVPGASVLPPSIRGAWAWIGTCTEVSVEISQLPGAPRGSVRGIGSGTGEERYGWMVPRAGCRSASRRVTAGLAGPPAADPPSDVREVRTVACWSSACSAFVGLDAHGRAVALLIDSGAASWVRLGPGTGGRR